MLEALKIWARAVRSRPVAGKKPKSHADPEIDKAAKLIESCIKTKPDPIIAMQTTQDVDMGSEMFNHCRHILNVLASL